MIHLGRKAARKRAYRPHLPGDLEGSARFVDSVTLPSRNGYSKAELLLSDMEATVPVSPVQLSGRNTGHHSPRSPRAESVPVQNLKSLNLGASESPSFHNVEMEADATRSISPEVEAKATLNRTGTTSSAGLSIEAEDSEIEDDLSFLELHIRTNTLPFLKRNLHIGFEDRFIQSNSLSGSFPPVHIALLQQEEENARPDEMPWRFTQIVHCLICPFCVLFKPFSTITRLIWHIKWDHNNYSVAWKIAQGEDTYELEFTNRRVFQRPASIPVEDAHGDSLKIPNTASDFAVGSPKDNEDAAENPLAGAVGLSQTEIIIPNVVSDVAIAAVEISKYDEGIANNPPTGAVGPSLTENIIPNAASDFEIAAVEASKDDGGIVANLSGGAFNPSQKETTAEDSHSAAISSSSLPVALQSNFSAAKALEKRAIPRNSLGIAKSFGLPARITPSTDSPLGRKKVVREVITISSDSGSETAKPIPIPIPIPTAKPKKLEPSKTAPILGSSEIVDIKVPPIATESTPAQRRETETLSGPPHLPEFTKTNRPGGPFLYDLLPAPSADTGECLTLPKEDEWYSAHQSEEIFEVANMLDEDKVMAALWNRHMLIHRTVFLANRYNGILLFVESNYRMIIKAAGRDALRALLLVLMTDRCLNPAEVARLLRIFDSLASPEGIATTNASNQ